jgi:hypothetical protein
MSSMTGSLDPYGHNVVVLDEEFSRGMKDVPRNTVEEHPARVKRAAKSVIVLRMLLIIVCSVKNIL